MAIAGDRKYEIGVVDGQSLDGYSEAGRISSGVLTFVYTAGTKTLATLYADKARTALANPITRTQFGTDGMIKFYAAAESVDIVINDDKGNTGDYPGVTYNTHVVKLNRTGSKKCLVFPIVFNSGGTETDTGLDLPKFSKVLDAAIEVVTIDATETIQLGLLASETNGDADGFLVSIDGGNAGFYGGVVSTVGSTETYISAVRYGALLGKGSVGTDAANDFGQPGGWGHFVVGSNAVSISYTPSSSDTLGAYGYVWFETMR